MGSGDGKTKGRPGHGRYCQIALALVSALTIEAASAGQSLHYLPLNQGYGDGGLWLDFGENQERDWFTRFTEPYQVPARSTVSLHRDFSDYALHWGVADSAEQNAQSLGLQFYQFRFTGFRGDGDTISSVIHPFNNVGNFQFHGGLKQRYQYSGARLDYDIDAVNRLNFSHARITAPGFNDRTAYELGLAGKNLSLSVTRVEETSQYAGRAISASAGFGRYLATLQHLQADNDARYTSLRFDTTTRNGNSLELTLEQRVHPLFDEGNESRITIGLRRSIGSNPSLGLDGSEAGASGPGGENTGNPGSMNKNRNTAILAGLGAVGVAIALSSGGGDGDDRNRFATQDAAAIDVLNAINPASIAENREYGGYTYRYADGSYAYTQPVKGDNDSVFLPNPFSVSPPGTTPSASYHTHAAFDPLYVNEQFSPQDLATNRNLGIDGYLGTPAGRFLFYDLSINSIFFTAPGFLATSF